MRRSRLPLSCLVLLLIGSASLRAQSPSLDARVEALLAQMTVEEKVGEMTQITLEAVSRTRGTPSQAWELDPAKLEAALLRYHVGSMLNVWDMAMTPAQWTGLITEIDRISQQRRLKIPVLYGIDAVHGHHYMTNATLFPHQLALGATWNPEVVRRANEITSLETRASGIPWNFAPVLDLSRQPLWSRFFEGFSEDVHLSTVLGKASVEGQEVMRDGVLQMAATGKHFLGYSVPRTGKDRTPATISDRELFEYFVPPFRAAMEAGLRTVMINSGEINGVPVHADRRILVDLLRDDLGFEGVAVTDWEDIIKLHTFHRVASSQKEAVRMAVEAGIDMSMVPYNFTFYDYLVELVREGTIPESRLDESVRRILRLKMELGLFENALPQPDRLAEVGNAEFQAVSRQAATESFVLLENDGNLLPLSKSARVLVTGPGASSLPALHGSWSYTWQGIDAGAYPQGVPTVLEALQAEVGAGRVTYVPGVGGAKFDTPINIPAAVAAARRADVAVVVLAEFPSVEQPGDIEELELPAAQRQLAQAILATGKPTVLVLLFNRPLMIRDLVEPARAVLLSNFPGPHGGPALADLLYGDANPSGRLPFTYPRFTGALATYDHKNSETTGPQGFNPLYPFGFGLGYTTFAYRNLAIADTTLAGTETLDVSVTVTNTGSRAGQEVVQLYTRDRYATVTPSVKRLRAFEKVSLNPGQSTVVRFQMPVASLGFVRPDLHTVVEPGSFEVMVGDQKASFTVTSGVAFDRKMRPTRF